MRYAQDRETTKTSEEELRTLLKQAENDNEASAPRTEEDVL